MLQQPEWIGELGKSDRQIALMMLSHLHKVREPASFMLHEKILLILAAIMYFAALHLQPSNAFIMMVIYCTFLFGRDWAELHEPKSTPRQMAALALLQLLSEHLPLYEQFLFQEPKLYVKIDALYHIAKAAEPPEP